MKPIKVHLVDDDPIFVFLTCKTIENSIINANIKVYGNGEEIINFLEENAADEDLLPDIIFLDLNMPVMDGWDFLESFARIKERFSKKISIYLLSSTISPFDIDRAANIPEVTDFLIKPLSKEKFLELFSDF